MSEAQVYQSLTDIFRDLFKDDSLVLLPSTTAADIPDWDSRKSHQSDPDGRGSVRHPLPHGRVGFAARMSGSLRR